jgi:hypothetical protein
VHYWLAKYFGEELRKGRFRPTKTGANWSKKLRAFIAHRTPEASPAFEREQKELRLLWKVAKRRVLTMLEG